MYRIQATVIENGVEIDKNSERTLGEEYGKEYDTLREATDALLVLEAQAENFEQLAGVDYHVQTRSE